MDVGSWGEAQRSGILMGGIRVRDREYKDSMREDILRLINSI